MFEVFQSNQSSSSLLMSALLNIVLIVFIAISIKKEGRRYLPIKLVIAIYLGVSAIAYLVQV